MTPSAPIPRTADDWRPRRWRHVDDPRPVGIVHAPADRSTAVRLLGDARSLGVSAVLLSPSETVEECAAVRTSVRGLLLVHTSSVWWSDAQLAEVADRITAGDVVAVARFSESRYPKLLSGLPVLLLSGRRYQTDQDFGLPGHTFLAELFGVGPDPTGEARRGFVFVSYRGEHPEDVRWVANEIVPALAEHGFGIFDYRATEELDEQLLTEAHDRWLERSAVLLVVATANWDTSPYTLYELRTARALGRPVVVLRNEHRSSSCVELESVGESIVFESSERDAPRLAAAIRRAVGVS